MRTLPDNPDLGHLRQQAKDLLAGLRDTEPATSLATAQAALARQYGFRSWPELKAEADRLRGGAEAGDPELARAVADAYDLGAVTGGLRSVARQDEMGRRWSLDTERGRWAVRTMDAWWPIVSAEDDVALQEAAAKAGVLLPAPVLGRTGNVVESIGGHDWRVSEWRHSGPPLVAPAGAAVTRAVGEVLGTLHGLALPVDRVSPWHAARMSDVSWGELAARAGNAEWAAALTDAVPGLDELGAIDGEPAGPVLTHNALTPGVVRRGPGGRLVVFGWEHAGGQPPAWELCGALLDWTVDAGRGVNPAGARALVDGYRAVTGSVPALHLGAFRGALTALANYLCGQVRHALSVTGEDRRFADRNVRHLLSSLPTPATLGRLLDAAR
ncbi:phosphotransferase [Actinophytocola oryzae]|uniref:Ser/Thr protein kinase RdoA (MazF antagonist) n=1 Tax=Actinophytocola oryzae TaxID=502181 RepID=A0A4R7V264_9PSEU|nr:phosphotransferase [Actinophytocola oryzae]TDV42657.1 Ser/Thr protein kinase RdoA (MazF antagonist) [Actinophytocola oryzae]